MSAPGAAAAGIALAGAASLLERTLAFAPPSMSVLAVFVLVTIGQFACYGRLLRLAARHAANTPEPAAASSRRERTALLAAPALLWVALACAPPVLSMDVFSYLAHGHQLNTGTNPYAVATREVGAEPYGRELMRWGWLPVHDPSPYGPLWTQVEGWAQRRSASLYGQMLWLKLPVVLAGLLCVWVIGSLLTRLAPGAALPAAVFVLWNPLVIAEVAVGGHNDTFMLLPCLVALWLFARERHATGTMAVCTAALVKINALVVAPPLAGLIVRGGRDQAAPGPPTPVGTVAWRVATASAGAILIALAGAWLYQGLWIGEATFQGLRIHAVPNITPSTGGTLFYYLTRTHAETSSARVVSLALNGALAGLAILAAAQATTLRRALTACAALSLAVLVLSSSYWPWYVVTPVALAALATDSPLVRTAAVLFSLFGRLAAPIDRLRLNGLMDWPTEAVVTTIIGLWIPAAVVLVLLARQRWGLPRLGAPGSNGATAWSPAAR